MRITAFIGAVVLGMAMMAFAPGAMALDDPPPEICLFDLSQPVDSDLAPLASAPTCDAMNVAEVRVDPASIGGDQGDAAPAHCVTSQKIAFDFAGHRQHEDPGRCAV